MKRLRTLQICSIMLYVIITFVSGSKAMIERGKPKTSAMARNLMNDSSAPKIFWNGMSDEEFLKEIEAAENELRIYIYPIPLDTEHLKAKRIDSMPHFQSEQLFRDYLRHFSSAGSTDNRHHMIVSDPEMANVFLIDHDWMKYNRHNCHAALDRHMTSIIHNVVDLHPYFNRSKGRDHFIMAVYDKGAFCDMECADHGNKDVLFRISSASFIGNYGMDKKTFFEDNSNKLRKDFKQYGHPCHRAGQDIVIPQLVQWGTRELFKKFTITHIPFREFDTTFSGSNWGDRAPAKEMSYTAEQDYAKLGTEKFGFYIEGGSPDHSLKYRGYFMYNPCGLACWSQRLYEALAVYTVPIIVAEGGIQAFERFIDWREFSVKLDIASWYNKTALYDIRRHIRHEGEDFRSKLILCWKTEFGVSINASQNIDVENSVQLNKSWVDAGKAGRNEYCKSALETFYWKKSIAIERVLPWLDFNDATATKMNAFRLLTLEIWCQLKAYKGLVPDICNRPVDYTARMHYF